MSKWAARCTIVLSINRFLLTLGVQYISLLNQIAMITMYSRCGQIAIEDASISDQPIPADEADELMVQTEVGMHRCSHSSFP
jgi:hypothetical protein